MDILREYIVAMIPWNLYHWWRALSWYYMRLQFIVLMNQCFLFLKDISSLFTSFPTLLAVFFVCFRWEAELQDLLLAPKSTAFVQDATGLHTPRYLRGEIGSLCNFQLGKEPKGKCIKHRFSVCQIFRVEFVSWLESRKWTKYIYINTFSTFVVFLLPPWLLLHASAGNFCLWIISLQIWRCPQPHEHRAGAITAIYVPLAPSIFVSFWYQDG